MQPRLSSTAHEKTQAVEAIAWMIGETRGKPRAFFAAFVERVAGLHTGQSRPVQLSQALGMFQQAVAVHESDQRIVPIFSLPLLASTLGVTVEDLIGM